MLRGMLTALAMGLLLACAQTGAANPPPALASATHEQDLLDNLVGRWELTGTIAGQHTTHDVVAARVLQGRYVRVDEVSRERDSAGRPQYEATIFIGRLEDHYVCTWFDNTGVASGDITCIARETPDALPFEFRDRTGTLQIATTFRYDRADDHWTWTIDNVENGRTSRFADLTMRRR